MRKNIKSMTGIKQIAILIVCLIFVGCSHKPDFIIPDQEPVSALSAIFLKEGDRYYTNEAGFKNMNERDRIKDAYIERLKSIIYLYRERE